MATRKKKETAKKAEPKVPIEVKKERPGDPTTMGWKLAQVLGEIHSIPKEGVNDHYGYKYVLEDTLTNQIRPILARWGISLVFGAEKVEDLDGQGQGYWTRVWCRFTLFDSDGHEFSTLCPGEGTDAKHPDKALYKAMTGSTKYFLYKTFLVSTGDEPERDDSPDTTLRKRKQQSTQERTQTPPKQDADTPDMMTSDQRERLQELGKGNNNFTEQLVKVLGKILDEGGTEGSAKRIIAECERQNKELQEHKEQQTNGEDTSVVASSLTEEENEEDIPF